MQQVGAFGAHAARAVALPVVLLVVGCLCGPLPAAEFVLLHKDLKTQDIQLAELGYRELVHVEEGGWRSVPLEDCVAIFDRRAGGVPLVDGILVLADGQRIPGLPMADVAPTSASIAWHHPWLGRLDVPLDMVRLMQLSSPPPPITPGDEDVVLLANGDRQEGFVIALGDPISLEVVDDIGRSVIQIPLERAAAVSMVTPQSVPAGRRVWFHDGTVIDVSSIQVGDDGFVRLMTRWSDSQQEPARARLEHVAAVLFDPESMKPLASIRPSSIQSPPTRYRVPDPLVRAQSAPLGMSRITLRGPLSVRYVLPAGARRFAAQATLPSSAYEWGHLELTVRDDERVVYRQTLDIDNATVAINIPLEGSELTIQLAEGRYGPIQDVLVLDHALVLVE